MLIPREHSLSSMRSYVYAYTTIAYVCKQQYRIRYLEPFSMVSTTSYVLWCMYTHTHTHTHIHMVITVTAVAALPLWWPAWGVHNLQPVCKYNAIPSECSAYLPTLKILIGYCSLVAVHLIVYFHTGNEAATLLEGSFVPCMRWGRLQRNFNPSSAQEDMAEVRVLSTCVCGIFNPFNTWLHCMSRYTCNYMTYA